ncbi:uncharacterized protein AUP68_04050 [Ilyonectria robusta]
MIVLDEKHIPRYARAAAFDKHGEVQGLTASVDIVSGKILGKSSSIWRLATDTDEDNREGDFDGHDYEDEEDAATHPSMPLTSVVALLVTIIMGHML